MTLGRFGLPQVLTARIRSAIVSNPRVHEVKIFGSRAKGNFREGSDIDLALFGDGLNLDDILAAQAALDELDLPWRVDLVIYERIDNPELTGHIDRVGAVL